MKSTEIITQGHAEKVIPPTNFAKTFVNNALVNVNKNNSNTGFMNKAKNFVTNALTTVAKFKQAENTTNTVDTNVNNNTTNNSTTNDSWISQNPGKAIAIGIAALVGIGLGIKLLSSNSQKPMTGLAGHKKHKRKKTRKKLRRLS